MIWRVVVTYSSGVSGGIPAHRASRHWCLPASCILCCVIWRVVVTYSSGVSGGIPANWAATSVSQLAVSYIVWFDVSLSHIAVVYLGGFMLIGRAATSVSQLAVSYIVWFDVSLSHIAVVYLGGFLLIGRAATGVSQLAVSYVVWFDVSLSHIAVVYLIWVGHIPAANRASRHWCLPASCILYCVIWRVVVTYSSVVSGGIPAIGRAATGVSQLAVSYIVWFDVSLSHIAVVYLGGFPATVSHRVIWRVVTYSSGVSLGRAVSPS